MRLSSTRGDQSLRGAGYNRHECARVAIQHRFDCKIYYEVINRPREVVVLRDLLSAPAVSEAAAAHWVAYLELVARSLILPSTIPKGCPANACHRTQEAPALQSATLSSTNQLPYCRCNRPDLSSVPR